MIGGAPIFAPSMPVYPQQQYAQPQPYAPPQQYAPPRQYAPAPQPHRPQPRWSGQSAGAPAPRYAPAPAQAAPASAALGRPTPPPRIRMQSADEPIATTSSSLQLPAPEALGLNVQPARPMVKPTMNDLGSVQRRLDQLGAMCMQVNRVDGGRSRVVCLFETRQTGRNHRIEAEARTALEAAALVLARAEDWRHSRADSR